MVGFCDVHTHILPKIDDGPDNIKETIRILETEYEAGVRTIYATPHFRRDMFEPTMEMIQEQYKKVVEAAKKVGDDLHVLLGCELHVNSEVIELLDTGRCVGLAGTRCVLVEFSEYSDSNIIHNRCYELLSNGYQPIIAHAERYNAIRKNLNFLQQLVEMGNYIQMNADSIVGHDGLSMKWFCKKAIKRDLLHFVGSDVHNTSDRKSSIGKCVKYLEKMMGQSYVRKVMITNPREIIEEGR